MLTWHWKSFYYWNWLSTRFFLALSLMSLQIVFAFEKTLKELNLSYTLLFAYMYWHCILQCALPSQHRSAYAYVHTCAHTSTHTHTHTLHKGKLLRAESKFETQPNIDLQNSKHVSECCMSVLKLRTWDTDARRKQVYFW